ncbi:MAG: pseudouridine synthase [Planctomycetota bacterium]|jgi:23S rRNA pseudouridine2605 synthase|nr:pseudouridine synthase [Planctomycetota bacterium]
MAQEERLHKFLARCGVDSRRKCEDLIRDGVVSVNGQVARELGVKINPAVDRVTVSGRPIQAEELSYYLHYKVKGITTTVSDDLGRRTIMDCLPQLDSRVYPVGRLDRESEGLLLLTNDGALANYLTHPAFGVEKTYRVVVEGRVAKETLAELAESGIRLGPILVKPQRVELVRHDNDNSVILATVAEGVNREVRRIFAALGHEVKRLLRIQVGPLTLQGMKRGATRPLVPAEVALLKRMLAGEKSTPAVGFHHRRPRVTPSGRRPGKPDPANNRRLTNKRFHLVEDDWVKKPPRLRPPQKDPETTKDAEKIRSPRGKSRSRTPPVPTYPRHPLFPSPGPETPGAAKPKAATSRPAGKWRGKSRPTEKTGDKFTARPQKPFSRGPVNPDKPRTVGEKPPFSRPAGKWRDQSRPSEKTGDKFAAGPQKPFSRGPVNPDKSRTAGEKPPFSRPAGKWRDQSRPTEKTEDKFAARPQKPFSRGPVNPDKSRTAGAKPPFSRPAGKGRDQSRPLGKSRGKTGGGENRSFTAPPSSRSKPTLGRQKRRPHG